MAVDTLNEAGLRALPDTGPVVMVNLLKLRRSADGGTAEGWAAYERYSAAVITLIKGCGGTVLWAGDVGTVALGLPAEGDWDFVVLVRYPSRRAFLDMMASDAYAAANRHRLDGTERHVILASTETYSKFAARA